MYPQSWDLQIAANYVMPDLAAPKQKKTPLSWETMALFVVFIIPQRYVLAIMGLLAIANAYTMRVCLNLAITQMVKRNVAVEGDEHYDPLACPDLNLVENVTSSANLTYNYRDETMLFEWSEVTQGLLLGSFYYGYVLTHIPGGMLAERFGGKWVLGLGLLSTAICTIITPITVRLGLIMHEGSWENVFYLFGGLGIIWFLLWIGHDWGYFTMVTDLPKYMTDVLKFNIKSTGTMSALPYVAMWISSFFFGLLCDYCIKRKWHSITTARKLYTTIAATGPGICILLASYSGCDTTLAVFWFVFAMTLMGAYYSGMKINPLDITPNYAGTTTALVNGIAAISAIETRSGGMTSRNTGTHLGGNMDPCRRKTKTLRNPPKKRLRKRNSTAWIFIHTATVLTRFSFSALLIPQRYILGILGLFALANSFTMRVCLSMTITQMVLHAELSDHIVGETCPDPTVPSNSSLLSDPTDVVEVSAFYYGYVITHLPGGLLAEKFGGKWTLGIGLLITSVATALTPLAVSLGGATGLFIIRGPVTPAFVLLMARWVPPSERSRFGAMIFGGAQIGNIFGPYISGLILHDGGDWANVFYFFGGLGVIWFFFWVSVLNNSHPLKLIRSARLLIVY
ncbi:Uncharacterized protein OBRU01_11390 [Operophtera brumata]|uniref:Major facilitator superfamily (MFS) profile domain-containing protein n=1 Tax=Operophtera brumata TaxID=104452 RepID=A0A0L7LBZ8_OPEBR|nr:Uncharacterized protein OBRU01_11390 [Operophtera brumata]